MKAVFLDSKTFSANISFSRIEQQTTSLTCFETTATDQLLERCQDADIVITNKVVLNAELLAKMPQLKLICIAATGYNNVDIEAASKHNIAVTNVSGYAGNAIAQYVFSQILAYYQNIHHHNKNTAQGLWQKHDIFCFHGNTITELAGKTLAIVGNGCLGQSVAKLANAFDMNVLISERPQSKDVRSGRVSFETAITQADILSLHCPQTPETTNLINATVLNKMKPTAMLINTARGMLVNSADLLTALKTKQIGYAALDVLEQEPPPVDHPLLVALHEKTIDNLSITAHIAWASSESQQRLINLLADNILAFNEGARVNRLDNA